MWETPPPILLWAAVVGVGINLVTFLWGLRHRHIDRKRSIVDEFWYRTIILPICWKPLIDLINEYVGRLHEINSEVSLKATLSILQHFAAEFGADKNRVLGRCRLLEVFRNDIYKKIEETLDALEDDIAKYCGEIEQEANSVRTTTVTEHVEHFFWSHLATICKEMMKLHPK